MVPKPVILVLDEDPSVAGHLERESGPSGPTWSRGSDLTQARRLCGEVRLSAIVSEFRFADGEVTEFCRWLRHADRRHQNLPLLVLSGHSTEAERVAVLEAGADDFVAKPYSVREVWLRIRRLVRPLSQALVEPGKLRLGAAVLDLESRRMLVGRRELELSPTGFRLLHVLFRHGGAVCTREVLLREAWAVGEVPDPRVVDTGIGRLRHELAEFGGLLQTVRGVGYRFVPCPPAGDPASSPVPHPSAPMPASRRG